VELLVVTARRGGPGKAGERRRSEAREELDSVNSRLPSLRVWAEDEEGVVALLLGHSDEHGEARDGDTGEVYIG
jgi:hypothetical protein